jgi:hypothetical protein
MYYGAAFLFWRKALSLFSYLLFADIPLIKPQLRGSGMIDDYFSRFRDADSYFA